MEYMIIEENVIQFKLTYDSYLFYWGNLDIIRIFSQNKEA